MTKYKEFGGHSMVNPLQRVLVRRPNNALGEADPNEWHYTQRVNLSVAEEEHNLFTNILKKIGVEVLYHDQVSLSHADAIFVHDPALITNHGAIILKMGKALRMGEEALIKKTFETLNIPILGEISSPGLVEGGDLLWLDDETLLAGKGFRTNDEGIEQLRTLLLSQKVQVLDFDLSYFQGKNACLHLQSFISLVDVKTALVYLPLMPVRLYDLLLKKQFHIIEVPEQEFLSMGPNVLTIKPKVLLCLDKNPITIKRLRDAGMTVFTYKGDELSLKTEGGPTCLTRPLKRE